MPENCERVDKTMKGMEGNHQLLECRSAAYITSIYYRHRLQVSAILCPFSKHARTAQCEL